MGIINNLFSNSLVKNAVQQQKNSINTQVYSNDINPYDLFDKRLNIAGKYDNFYGDSNKIVSVASSCGLYYVDADNNILDDTKENTFAYYIKNPNDSYPQTKVLSQIYTELITHGHCDLFFYHKDGSDESRIFDKVYPEDDFRGITLVSGEDKSRLTKKELANIVRITYGVSQQNVFMGYSPTQAAQSWRKMQDEMGLHMTKFAKNSGMPIGKFIITAPSPEEYVKLRDSLDGKISGAKNNGKILYDYRPSGSKDSQIEWVQFTSNKVQDYTPQLEFAEKKISQDFGVPGTIKGTNDSENYATAGVSRQNFMLYTIKPLVDSTKEQLEFFLSKKFIITGELKSNIVVPELADESLVKIQATAQQVVLFDQKIAEGYSAESIVSAFGLPESFLLLEKSGSSSNSINKVKNSCKCDHHKTDDDKNLGDIREYQNKFTEKERDELERKFKKITDEYANYVLENGLDDESRVEYEGKMSVEFSSQYSSLYDKALDDVSVALADIIGTIDVDNLHLTEEELNYAVKQYNERVTSFSESFAKQIEALDGETLEVRQVKAEPYVKRVVVTESEHTRIVSELKCWTKSTEEFPVKVWKTWKSRNDSRVCPDCTSLDGTTIDVTKLFVNSPNIDEIYEVQGGGLHPNCRCSVVYEMESTDAGN